MGETTVTHPMRVFTYATLSIAIFSCMNVFLKLASEHHAVIEVMFFRNAIAVIPVLMLMRAHPEGWNLFKTRRPLGHLLRGTVGTVSMSCIFWSFSLLPLADATALQFAMPLMLTALSVHFLKERVGRWRWGAVIVGFIGVLFIAAPSGNANWLGILIALMGAFLTACVMIIVRRLGRTEHALTIVFYFSLWGAILCACFLPWYWTQPTPASLTYLVMTGICGGAAQVLLTKAYAEAPAAYVSAFSYLAIIFSAFFGWVIWAQPPTHNVIIGSCIVIASGLFILYREVVMKRHVVQDTLTDLAPTEADEFGPAPEAQPGYIPEEAGQNRSEMTYHGPLKLPEELK